MILSTTWVIVKPTVSIQSLLLLRLVSNMKVNKNQEKELVKIFTPRIERGVRWLNKNVGKDWTKKINVTQLNLNSGMSCVIGQAFGSFWMQVARNYSDKGDKIMNLREAKDRGFFIEAKVELGYPFSWDLLTYMWAQKIVEVKFKNGFN